MKATFLIFALATSLFAVEKSDENNLKILQKQIEHQLSVKGDAAGATSKCLLELKNKSLNKEQKQIFQQLLNRSAIQSTDLLVVREAAAYLTTHNIPCDKLKQRLSLGLPENLNTNLNKNIREALDYQWNNLKWQTDSSDYSVFDGYLSELTENTNITQCARAQTALLRTIISAWKDFADIIELDFKIVDKQYERLLVDLQCPKDKEKLIEVKKALDRFYETAREYMNNKSPYLAIAAVINLSYYSADAATDNGLKDISSVQINKLFKQSSSFVEEEYIAPKLEKEKPYIFVVKKTFDQCMNPKRITMRLEYQNSYGFIFVKFYGWFYGNSVADLDPKLKKLPTDINILTNSMYYKYANNLKNIVFPKEKLVWKQGENKMVEIGNRKYLVNKDWYYTTPIGKWDQAVWNERFSKLENDILKIEAPLNEIRKYVYDNYEKERIEKQQQLIEKKKINEAFLKELKIFIAEGPKENDIAMKARDELLKLLEKYPDYGKHGILDALRGYPEKICNMPGFLSRLRGKINARFKLNSSQWIAWQYYGEIKNLESVIKKEKDPQLITKYFQTIIKKLDDEFPDEKYPGLQLAIKTANRNNMTVIITNLIPYISSQLDEIAKGKEEKNAIINLADGIDSCVKSLKDKMLIDNYQIIQFSRDHSLPWPANRQCDFAQSTCYDICNYSNLNKQEKAKKIVGVYNVLIKTMRECSYFATNRPNYVTFLDFADGLDKSVPLIYKCLSELNKKYYNYAQYSLSSFLVSKYRPDRQFWKERAQFDDLRDTINKYYYIYLSSEQQRIKLIIEKLMSFVHSVKADAGQLTGKSPNPSETLRTSLYERGSVDWIVKFGLTNKFSKVEEVDLPVDGYIIMGKDRIFGFKDDRLRVTSVTRNTPASNAGIQVGDDLISINGNDIKNMGEVRGFRNAVYNQYVPYAYLGIRRGDKKLLYKIVKDQPDKNELDKTAKTKTKSNEEIIDREMKIFFEEGPKVNEKAMKARDELLKMLSISPEFGTPEVVEALKKYPEVTKESINILLDDPDNITRPNWLALGLYNEIQEFQKTISSIQKPELVMQFINSFLIEFWKSGISRFSTSDYPALRTVFQYMQGSANKNVVVTNFVPVLANELKRIADGNTLPEDALLNYIQLLDEWIPVAVNAEQNGMKNSLMYVVGRVNSSKFDWQAKARIELAKKNITSYKILPERKRILKTVEALVELERGLREDAGQSTEKSPNPLPRNTRDVPLYKRGTDWVKKLGLDKPAIKEFYELKEVYFPKRSVELLQVRKFSTGVNLQLKINGKSQFKKESDTIFQNRKELYKIGKVTFKKEEVYNKLINSTQYIDKSSVEMENLQTGEKFTLTIGEESTLKSAEAKLLQLADNKERTIKVGDKVPLDDKKTAKVTNINVQNQTVTFVTGSETKILKVSHNNAKPEPKKSDEKVTLNFKNVPVVDVLKYLSDLKGDIVLPSPYVTNKNITIVYHKPVTPQEAKEIIIESFRLQNYSLSIEEKIRGGQQTITIRE